MEEVHPTRRSSTIYNHSLASHSGASLRGNALTLAGTSFAEAPGFARTTPPGLPALETADTIRDSDNAPNQLLPVTPPQPFYKKRWFIVANIILIPLGIALLFIVLFPVLRSVVQLVVNRSTLNVNVAAISQPQNDTFQLSIEGTIAHTGVFNAKIQFTEPIDITWVEGDNLTPLGSMTLEMLSVENKRAIINQTTSFSIINQDAFGRFAAYMITSQNFTWRLSSHNLHVEALKFPVARGITFEKDIVLKGFNSFNGNVLLEELQLPSDNPDGGINYVAVTQLTNPSPFSINLGTVVFDLSYQNVTLGSGTGLNTRIVPGTNNITLSGVLEPHTSSAELAVISELFTNYINSEVSSVIAAGRSTLQSDNSTISWLSQGLQALQLTVPFKPSTPIDPIKTITIGNLNLAFSEKNPWSPIANSDAVQATLGLPFGFGISIGEIQNNFNITRDSSVVAGLAVPLGRSVSDISVLSSDDTGGYINISIVDTPLNISSENQPSFSSFTANLTNSTATDFRLEGNARAVANISIGTITLDPIKFNVSASMLGLQGLNGLTKIESVDVMGGTVDGIDLAIIVSIFNPSNLSLATGDLSLQLFRNGSLLGTTLLPNLTLGMGLNSINASSNFEANNSPQGLQTLDDFVGKKDVALKIAGYSGSTKIAPLLQAFETLNIGVTLPGLKTNLLDSAALEVLPTTGLANNISHVTVDLDNPFSAALDITSITSTVKYSGILLGSIQSDNSFTSAPKSKTTSPVLDLDMNLDPATLFTVTRALAVAAGLDTAPLDAIVQIGGIQYLSTTGTPSSNSWQRRDSIFTGFNLPDFVQAAFKKLQSDVELTASVNIGDYSTTLQYTQLGIPTDTDKSLDFILPILAKPIVQTIVGGSNLGIDTVLIKSPQQLSFITELRGGITNAGPFDATISFGTGLTVAWSGKPIGTIQMNDIKVTGDVGGTFDVQSTFEVADVAHLTEFTKILLTEESFDWQISGENLTVSALGIDVTGLSLPTKTVTLKGFNGLKNGVTINSFDLPSNDPAGGIHLTINASTTNPSQVGIELSSIGFQTFVGDVMIAPVDSAGAITLAPGVTTQLSLVGRLIPQDSTVGLAAVSSVFNNFVHGLDSNVIVQGASAGPSDVTWLNDGIKSLQVATVLPNQGALDVIKSISLNQLQLLFTEDTAYNPATSSNSTDAAFALPFAFPIDISSLEQTITVGFNGQDFAQLALPKAPSTTDVDTRIVHLTFSNVPFAVFGNQHSVFDDFVAATTIGKKEILHLSGAANADAETAVGTLSLTDIAFSVDSSIEGLQGLNARPVEVASLDVNHGYPDYLLIKVSSFLFNPSNLTIGTGDVSFALVFEDQTIGSADISNLLITPGNQSQAIDVHYAPQGGAQAVGQVLLENYIQGINSDTTIIGTTSSTPIESLKSALSQIQLSPVTIPALHQGLISSASLIFPLDIVQTGIASASFTLTNPFTASVDILKLGAIATFQQLTLGTIESIDISSSPIHADGHSNVTSPAIPIHFNMDPVTIIELLSITAHQNGVDLGPLTELFQFIISNPNFKPPVNSSVDTSAPTCISGKQFDVADAILKSLAGLKVNLAVNSGLKLDDFATDLSFNQANVPAITDKTALYLIGAVASPVAQYLVDGASLAFTEANITNISDDGFDLALRGSLTNIGPLDAYITFTEPVTVTWQGNIIAQISLPPVCAAANDGVPDYQPNAKLMITDLAQFTSFATFLLHNPSFEWTISTPKLRVQALGTIFDNISLSKDITFKAFNGLPGVTVNNFQLPSDDPAGGIHIDTDANIPSLAQLGIDLGSVSFQAFYKGVLVGPLSGSQLFLAANAVTRTHLIGRIVPQSGSNLVTIGNLFSQFLAGENQTLVAQGDLVQPSGSSEPVTWLSAAFKTLSLDVILPGQVSEVIQSIALSDLSVTMQTQDQTFAPLTSSSSTIVTYKNPFGFPLQVIEAGEDIILSASGYDLAELKIPLVPVDGGVSTGNMVDLDISFRNQPLTSLNDFAFGGLFASVTLAATAVLELRGIANVVARTSIGDVPIISIPFDVPSSLQGINSFGGSASLSNVSVTGSGGNGGNEYIITPLTTTLQNPSNISLQTVDVALPVFFNDILIGHAAINPFNLVPGENVILTEFRYEPLDANDTIAQSFLTEFIQTDDQLDLVIRGDAGSTPFTSLQPAFSGLQLFTSLNGINNPNIITHVDVILTFETFTDNTITIDFDIFNPLDADLVLKFVQADASSGGTIYASFGYAFDNFVVPPGQTVNSGPIPQVVLTQGYENSLGLVALGVIDIDAASIVEINKGGYEIPWLHISQKDVPTNFQFSTDSLGALEAGAKALNTSLIIQSHLPTASPTQSSSDTLLPLNITPSSSLTEHILSTSPETISATGQLTSKAIATATTAGQEFEVKADYSLLSSPTGHAK